MPEGWNWTILGDISEIAGGVTLNKAREIENPLIVPYLRVANVQRGHLDLDEIKTVEIPKSRLDDYALRSGDVLFNEGGDRDKLGRGWVWNGEIPNCCHQNHVFRARPNQEAADSKFLSYWGNEFGREYFEREGRQTTNLASINRAKLRALPIPLPPLAEQKRIVAKIEELFSELDAGEESLRRARRQLGVYRQSLLKQAFEGKLTAPWRAQHPDLLESPDQLLARIQEERDEHFQQRLEEWEAAVEEWEGKGKDGKRPPKPRNLSPAKEEIPVFNVSPPDGWTTLNLSQCVLELGQGWSPKCENREANDNEWAVIKTTAIQFGHFDPSANKALPKQLPPRRWLSLRSGEILITRAGPRSRCGVVCRVREDHPSLMLCDKAYRLVLSQTATDPRFFELLLCSPPASAAIEKLKTGISDSGVNLTQTAFASLMLPIPSHPEQQEIVRLLDEQFEVIEQNEREIDAALKRSEALRQSILKKAFTGQLVPPACRQAGRTPEEFPQPRTGKWWVYVLKCNDGSFYKGFTDNLPQRWKRHLAGNGAKWTKQHPPVELHYWEEHWSEESAVERERFLKSGSGREWFQREIVENGAKHEPASTLLARIRAERDAQAAKQPKKKAARTRASKR